MGGRYIGYLGKLVYSGDMQLLFSGDERNVFASWNTTEVFPYVVDPPTVQHGEGFSISEAKEGVDRFYRVLGKIPTETM